MRYLDSCLLLLGLAAPALAQGPTLKEARQRWLRGNYEEARSHYETLVKDPKQKAAATVGLSRVLETLGEYDKALALLEAAVTESPDQVELTARLADHLHFR